MTKKLHIAILAAIAIILTSCAAQPAAPQNQIAPAALTDGQRDIINLLSAHSTEIHIFDFHTDGTIQNVEFWLEVYAYGVLIERVQGLSFSEPNPQLFDGQLAITIDRENDNRDFRWTFTVSQDGWRASNRFDSATLQNDGFAIRHQSLQTPIEIQNDTEIILYAAAFFRGNVAIAFSGDLQIFRDQPELLAEYPYVQIIKARFF